MPDDGLTPRERLRIDRERAAARCEAHFQELTDSYPVGHANRRDMFVREESERVAKELEQRHMQALPDAERNKRR